MPVNTTSEAHIMKNPLALGSDLNKIATLE